MKAKRFLFLTMGWSLVILLLVLLISAIQPKRFPIGSELPQTILSTCQGTDTLKTCNSNPTIIMFFNTNCQYCIHELASFENHLQDFVNCRIIFITYDDSFLLCKDPLRWPNLVKAQNVHWAWIEREYLFKQFDNIIVPSLFIFNTNGILMMKFKGETRIDKLPAIIRSL